MTSDNGTSAGHDLTELSDEQVHAALGDEESAHLEPVEVSDEVDEAASDDDADDESTQAEGVEDVAEAASDDDADDTAEAEPAADDEDPVAKLRAELVNAVTEAKRASESKLLAGQRDSAYDALRRAYRRRLLALAGRDLHSSDPAADLPAVARELAGETRQLHAPAHIGVAQIVRG